jgi:hypothetical protein
MAGWILADPNRPSQQKVVGTLSEVKPGKPQGGSGDDGDTGFMIRPQEPYYYLLKNHSDNWNDDVKIECEVNVWPQARGEHGSWVQSMSGLDNVTAVGVWVEDTGHGSKTELHPVDIIFSPVTSSLVSSDWLNQLAASRGISLQTKTLNLFRFAVATDVRAFFPFDEQSDGRPPLAGQTRPVTITVDLPVPQNPLIDPGDPAWEIRASFTHGTILDTHTAVRVESGKKVLDITMTPQSLSDDDFNARSTSDQAAAVLLGEFVTFWQSHAAHL